MHRARVFRAVICPPPPATPTPLDRDQHADIRRRERELDERLAALEAEAFLMARARAMQREGRPTDE